MNRTVLDRYLEIVADLEGLGADGRGVSADTLLGLPGVVEWEAEEAAMGDEAFLEGASSAVGGALDALVESRRTEGRALFEDFRARLDAIESRCRRVEELAPLREQRERERLREKVRTILQDPAQEMERRIERRSYCWRTAST